MTPEQKESIEFSCEDCGSDKVFKNNLVTKKCGPCRHLKSIEETTAEIEGDVYRQLRNFDNRARKGKKNAPKHIFEQLDSPKVIRFKRAVSSNNYTLKMTIVEIKQKLVYPLKLQSTRLMIKQAYELEQG